MVHNFFLVPAPDVLVVNRFSQATGDTGAQAVVMCLAQRMDDAVIKGLDVVLLLLADLWLRLDDSPEFDDVLLDLQNVD
jgi:hypothetical protein